MTNAVRVILEVPDEVTVETRAIAEHRAKESAVLAVWEAGEITNRQAASELGLGYHEFLDLLTSRGMAVARGHLNLDGIEEASQDLPSPS